MQVSSQMTLAELQANAPFGGAQLSPGRFNVPLSPGEANYYEFLGGDPDSLVTNDAEGSHYLIRELVGAGACHFSRVEAHHPQPHLNVHEIVTPDGLTIGTLVARVIMPDDAPRTFMGRISRAATKVVGWLVNEQPTPELQIRVRANPIWHQA